MMKVSHFVTALLVSIVVLLSGQLMTAPYNSSAYDALLLEKNRIEHNLVELQEHHDELTAGVNLLRRNTDTVVVESRRLGYYREDETVVRVEPAPAPTPQSPGRIIRMRLPNDETTPVVPAASLAAGLVVLLGQILGSTNRQRPIRRHSR